MRKAKSSAVIVKGSLSRISTGKKNQTYGRVRVEAKSTPAMNFVMGIALSFKPNLWSSLLRRRPTASSIETVRNSALRKSSS